jgi:tol-pal system protein YbgF
LSVRKGLNVVIMVLFVGSLIGCASESDLVMVQQDQRARMERLEQRLDMLEGQGQEGGIRKEIEDLKARQIELFNSVEEVRAQARDITGTLESDLARIKRGGGSDQLKAEVNALNQRVENLERFLGITKSTPVPPSTTPPVPTTPYAPSPLAAAPAPSPAAAPAPSPPAPKPAASATTPSADPDKLYEAAVNLYKSEKYEAAQKMFAQFVSLYPKNEKAGSAQFWIGECLFQRKQYGKAILEYQKVVEKYSKSTKVPDALLKQGLAFKYLGDKTSAKILLEKVRDSYPKTSQANVAQKELNKL